MLRTDTVNLLVVDDDPTILKFFEKIAQRQEWSFLSAASGVEGVELLAKHKIDVALIDLNLPNYTGKQILKYVRSNCDGTEVIFITGQAAIETAVSALKEGAYDFIMKPFENIDRPVICIQKALEKVRLHQKIQQLEKQDEFRDYYHGIVGRSRPMQDIYKLIDNISSSESPVLILGESGTGKELVARAVHETSPRKDRPFVVINCSALTETLLESELFGHVKGSFTGATSDKKGLFQAGDGGTVFLDEIGEVSPSVQVKLLRVLQDGDMKQIGANQSIRVDIRLIAATNRDLYQAVKRGLFREDLFYRINVIGVHVPSLRDRTEDVPLLAYHFMKKYSERTSKKMDQISVDAMQSLQDYKWMGNVRELENVIERAVVLCHASTITARDLPDKVLGETFYVADPLQDQKDLTKMSYQKAKDKALYQFNRNYIRGLLQETDGNISMASIKAGMDRSNFKKIIRKCDIDVNEFRKMS